MQISRVIVFIVLTALAQASFACFYTFGPLDIEELIDKSESIWVGELKSKKVTSIGVPDSCNDIFVEAEFEIDRTLKGAEEVRNVHMPQARIDGIDSGRAVVFVWTLEDINVGVAQYLDHWGKCEFEKLLKETLNKSHFLR